MVLCKDKINNLMDAQLSDMSRSSIIKKSNYDNLRKKFNLSPKLWDKSEHSFCLHHASRYVNTFEIYLKL